MKIYDYEGRANIISRRLRELRKKRNMSQDTLAAKMQLANIEISQKGISRIEKGERFVSDYELLAFSDILNIDVYWLLGISDIPSPPPFRQSKNN